MRSHRVACHLAEPASPALNPAVTDRYLIYPPIKDERLSRPEPTQVNDLPRVAKEVPAIAGVSWLSRPSAPRLCPETYLLAPCMPMYWQQENNASHTPVLAPVCTKDLTILLAPAVVWDRTQPVPCSRSVSPSTTLQGCCCSVRHNGIRKTWRNPRNRKYTTRAVPRRQATWYRIFGEVRTFGRRPISRAMRAVRQTDRQTEGHAHHNIRLPYRG